MTSLAERMRPNDWPDFFGQEKTIASIKTWLSTKAFPHVLLTGSPGSGKTTLAQILKNKVEGRWIEAHAADFSTKEVRSWIEEARDLKRTQGIKTFIFIDEIHRLTRTQQDVLLDPLEKYDFNLIGATTENPGSYLSPAILSRVRVLRLQPLAENQVEQVLDKTAGTVIPGRKFSDLVDPEVRASLVQQAAGDLRQALGRLELILQKFQMSQKVLGLEEYQELLGEESFRSLSTIEHAETLSAFIKSIRGSDPEAALLWMAQMLKTGTDPRLIARRMVISASEDIGNAEPRALPLAVAAAQAVELVGMPEIPIILSQAVIFLATAPKSDAAYQAVKSAQEIFDKQGPFKVPPHLTAIGGDQYENPHRTAHGFSKQNYRPIKLEKIPEFLRFSNRGFEKKLVEYWNWISGKPTANSKPASESEAGPEI